MSEGPFGLGRLSFERLEFKARALEEIRFGGFKGVYAQGRIWGRLQGDMLRPSEGRLPSCPIAEKCPFAYVFETSPKAEAG